VEFTIDRSKWRCGGSKSTMFLLLGVVMEHCEVIPDNVKGSGGTCLLNRDGFMCCLGQICMQCGVSADDILNKSSPSYLEHVSKTATLELLAAPVRDVPRYTSELTPTNEYIFRNTNLSTHAMKINDNNSTTPATKEKLLIDLFKESDHELSFYGEFAKDKE
jgi:hypothetical protein